MYETQQIADDITQEYFPSPLGLLQEQLADLLLIHHQHKHSAMSPDELPSLYLHKSQYVYGEKSVEKCSMQFALLVGPDAEANVTETLILTLSVKNEVRKC